MNSARASKELLVRVPLDVREWLLREAKRNVSSMSSEAVRAIRDRMDAQQAKRA
jgi:hypothetical protein